MVPLICQSLLTAPSDEAVWLEGLEMLCNPKLYNAMSATASIWLPLLLKGLETTRPLTIILAALRLLGEMAATLEPMKSCLLKPLRTLGKNAELGLAESDELRYTVVKLGLSVYDAEKNPIRKHTSVSRRQGAVRLSDTSAHWIEPGNTPTPGYSSPTFCARSSGPTSTSRYTQSQPSSATADRPSRLDSNSHVKVI